MSHLISLRKDEARTKEGRTKYRLLELPPDLCKLVETSAPDFKLTVKGKEGDDAVICTPNKTYTLRSVNVSNSLVVATGTGVSQNDIALGEDIHEIMELVPTMPKLDRLIGMLRGSEYGEDQMSEDENDPGKSRKYTRKDLEMVIQASDLELSNALKSNHILELDGYLRPLPLEYLSSILMYIFTSLVSYGLPRKEIPVTRLLKILEQDHEVPSPVSIQVMQWFGSLDGETWSMDSPQAVRQVGVGLLKPHAHESIAENLLMSRWREAVGDAFQEHVNLSLLRGEHILQASASGTIVTYFSRSNLSTDPLSRFNELFLTRSKWIEEDINPFIEDIAVDKKERDRLLLKFARRAAGTDGKVYYSSRTGI